MDMTYAIIDTRTGGVVGMYLSSKRARNRADKLDFEYGAIRYRVVRVDTI